jgi:hypothetical protein
METKDILIIAACLEKVVTTMQANPLGTLAAVAICLCITAVMCKKGES